MSEEAVTETLDSKPAQNATEITIMLNPQPGRDSACDSQLEVASVQGESPSSGDSESLHKSQMMVKKSLKLDLSHNNNEIKSIDTGSPINEDDLSFKSPSSPRTCEYRPLKFKQMSLQKVTCDNLSLSPFM